MLLTTAKVASSLRSVLQVSRKGIPGRNNVRQTQTVRCVTTTESGAFLEEPRTIPLGLFKIMGTVIPGLYIGASISRLGAAFLEENDIFVPDDDDDD